MSSAYYRLARIPLLDGSPTPQLGRDREILADDATERAEADRRVIGAWEKAHGEADIRSHAEEKRARLLMGRE